MSDSEDDFRDDNENDNETDDVAEDTEDNANDTEEVNAGELRDYGESAFEDGRRGGAAGASVKLSKAAASSSSSAVGAKGKRKGRVLVNLANCKYDVLHEICNEMGWRVCGEDEEWNLCWMDFSSGPERLMKMERFQRINHFPGMVEIFRKDTLAKNLNRMRKAFPDEFDFFPRTWVLPGDLNDLKAYAKGKKNKTFIFKPEASCQGRGIFLTRNVDDFNNADAGVVQQYLAKPYLIDDLKFDLRIYVLVLCCDPLRVFVHKEGLARFATEEYVEPSAKNLSLQYMHLTNYAINKHNENFEFNVDADRADTGSKRSLESVNIRIAQAGHDVEALWGRIYDVIMKTLISIQPTLAHLYHTCQPDDIEGQCCFEVLGFDVMLDSKLVPYVLEVNHSPSFTCDTPFDYKVKHTLLRDVCTLLNLTADDKRRFKAQQRVRFQQRLYGKKSGEPKESLAIQRRKLMEQRISREDQDKGQFVRIYPVPGSEKFDKFYVAASSLFGETAASIARRQQIQSKLKEMKDAKEIELARQQKRGRAKPPSGRRALRAPIDLLKNQQAAASRLMVERDEEVCPVTGLTPSQQVTCTESIDDDEERVRIRDRMMREYLIRCSGIREKVAELLLQVRPPDSQVAAAISHSTIKAAAQVPNPQSLAAQMARSGSSGGASGLNGVGSGGGNSAFAGQAGSMGIRSGNGANGAADSSSGSMTLARIDSMGSASNVGSGSSGNGGAASASVATSTNTNNNMSSAAAAGALLGDLQYSARRRTGRGGRSAFSDSDAYGPSLPAPPQLRSTSRGSKGSGSGSMSAGLPVGVLPSQAAAAHSFSSRGGSSNSGGSGAGGNVGLPSLFAPPLPPNSVGAGGGGVQAASALGSASRGQISSGITVSSIRQPQAGALQPGKIQPGASLAKPASASRPTVREMLARSLQVQGLNKPRGFVPFAQPSGSTPPKRWSHY